MRTPKPSKQLGILGGLSWHSTEVYYRLINQYVARTLGHGHSAKVIIHSLDFREITALFKNKKKGIVRLVDECMRLQDFGCDGILLASNTLHVAYESIATRLQIPVLHIADAVAAQLKNSQIACAGLLGTQYTMNLDFYRSRLHSKFGIEVLTPSFASKKIVDHIISEELVHGKLKDQSRLQLNATIAELKQLGASSVIAGCTELPLLIDSANCPLPVVDSMYEHCQLAGQWYCEG